MLEGANAQQILLNVVLGLISAAIIVYLSWVGAQVYNMNGKQESLISIQQTQSQAIIKLAERHQALRDEVSELNNRITDLIITVRVNVKPMEISELRALFAKVKERVDCLEKRAEGEEMQC